METFSAAASPLKILALYLKSYKKKTLAFGFLKTNSDFNSSSSRSISVPTRTIKALLSTINRTP